MGVVQCCSVEKVEPDKVLSPKGTKKSPKLLNENSNGGALTSPKSPAPKKFKGLLQIKAAVQKHMDGMKELRSFLKQHFKSPAEAWNIIAGDLDDDGLLQQDVFIEKMTELGFEGNSGKIFAVIDDSGKGITQQQFKQILSAQQKGKSFLDLVQQAKEKAAEEKRNESKGVSDNGLSKQQETEVSADGQRSLSPRNRGRSSSPRSSKRDSSPKAARRESDAKRGRSSSPKGERVRRKSIPEAEKAAEFGKANSTGSQRRQISQGSLASMSTSATLPSPANVKKKGL